MVKTTLLAVASLPVGATDPLPAGEQQACLAAWNKYRGMAGLEPLGLCPSFAQEQANYEASYDAGTGTFHTYCTQQGWDACYKTNCGEKLSQCGAYPNWRHTPGQCEYWEPDPVTGNATEAPWENAVKSMFAEGPGGGHYDTIVSPDAGCVACGYTRVAGKRWVTFNTCCKDDAPAPGPGPTPGPTPSPTPTPTPSLCLDVATNCDYQVQQGHCSTGDQYYQWMTVNCAKSCGFCEGLSRAGVMVV